MRLKLNFRSGSAVSRSCEPSRIRLSTDGAAFLRAELKRQPEIRPDVVARARALAADPNYPPMEILRKVAKQILASPDFSRDES